MEKYERPIIVPWDFSKVAENAFQHAVNISKVVNREILLLHIAHDSKDKEKKTVELKASAEKLGKEFGKKPFFEVVRGSIFHAIGETAQELKAEMIIMGTHGRSGFAHLLQGSVAEYVAKYARAPVMTVKDDAYLTEPLNLSWLESAGVPGGI